ncbi:MAG: iron-containing alcohol dehydrogenase [Geobacteraceae bacterium]|nr:iron-containing alcohol dehydrogenase [Geobacteraceae bacterium]
MNCGAVITNEETSEKSLIQTACLSPYAAVVDPELTLTVPRDQTAYGVIHASGLSPIQTSPEKKLQVDLYGTSAGPGGPGYRRMLELSTFGRIGTPEEGRNVADLVIMGPDGDLITGSDFLMDGGGSTASYFYGELASQ